MPVTTITVIKRPAQMGDFSTITSDHPIIETPNKIFAAADEMQFANDGETQLTVENRGVVATVIQFEAPDKDTDGVLFAVDERQAFTVPADSLVVFGPLSRKAYNNSSNNVVFTVSELSAVYLWARSNQR